ncbi:MAG: hypothetical protein ACRD23_01035 [Terriglobales bacterium]
MSERGYVREQTIENFLAAGYRWDQLLEVLIGVALKTMRKYLDHIRRTNWIRLFDPKAKS